MQNNDGVKTETTIPLFRILYKNLFLIIIIAIMGACLGYGYGKMYVKPVYTASRSLILSTAASGADAANTAALGKLYVSQVKDLLATTEYVQVANNTYRTKQNGKTPILTNSIGVSYYDSSLIFTLSYTDVCEQEAKAKLHAIYIATTQGLPYDMSIEMLSLIDTANITVDIDAGIYEGFTVSVSSGFTKCVILGFAIGFFLAIIITLLRYVLDNTVRDKNEIEEITGINVIAYISKTKNKKD